MSTPKQEKQAIQTIVELLHLKNPRAWLTDLIPASIRVFWKETFAVMVGNPHHHTIIPLTKNHTSWTLGAQPSKSSIKKVYAEDGSTVVVGQLPRQKKVHIVNMLAAREIITNFATDTTFNHDCVSAVSRRPWFDHGCLDLATGKNQTVASMREFQESFYDEFEKNPPETVFYCHCMAGRSRSFMESMSFIYFYEPKEKLFDFENWLPKIKERIPLDLQARLRLNPSFTDIAEFMQIQRPKVKEFAKLDGDQVGLLGLMVLSKLAEPKSLQSIAEQLENIQDLDKEQDRLYRDAREIGLILKAPLDQGFREMTDLEEQTSNFIAVYRAYQKYDINLLAAMITPNAKEAINSEESFKENFGKLPPSEQARLAILMQKLKDNGCGLAPLDTAPREYAKIAVERAKKLTAGDQIELLKTFGTMPGLGYADVVKKISTGSGLDRHNAGIQLAELLHSTKLGDPSIDRAIASNALSYIEQVNFVSRLFEVKDERAKHFAQIVYENYENRSFPLLNNPLSADKIEKLANIANVISPEQPMLKIKQDGSSITGATQGRAKRASYAGVIAELESVRGREKREKEGKKDEAEKDTRDDVAFKQFRGWIDKVKGQLGTREKQNLVKQFMLDPKNPDSHPGDRERLKAVLAVCTKEELGDELLKELAAIYPKSSNTPLAKIIAELPEAKAQTTWQQRAKLSATAGVIAMEGDEKSPTPK